MQSRSQNRKGRSLERPFRHPRNVVLPTSVRLGITAAAGMTPLWRRSADREKLEGLLEQISVGQCGLLLELLAAERLSLFHRLCCGLHDRLPPGILCF